MDAESTDGTDDETPGDGYYAAKASKKREKKQQEWEAQRQVILFHFSIAWLSFILFYFICSMHISSLFMTMSH